MTVSLDELKKLAPKGDARILAALQPHFDDVLPQYGIDTRLRFCHFIAQAAHETDGFKTLVEYGGADYFNKRYGPGTGPGKRVGNTQPGDGARFRGRGIFQLTGRYNYGVFGKKMGIDFLRNPQSAADPLVSLRVACEYWTGRKLNALADRDDVEAITKAINGGKNGLKDRQAYLARAESIWPYDFQFEAKVPMPKLRPKPASGKPPVVEDIEPDPVEEIPDIGPPIAVEAPPTLGVSKTLWGNVGTWIGGTGLGGAVTALLNHPQALWIIVAILVFGVLGAVGLAVVFRERFLKREEFGI